MMTPGSVTRLESGKTAGGFVCNNALAGQNCLTMVYEAEAQGAETARIRIPSGNSGSMAYWALPLVSTHWERVIRGRS